MIHFACQSCNKKLRTADTDAGKTRPCPKCRAMTLVPQPAAVELELAPKPEPPTLPVPIPGASRFDLGEPEPTPDTPKQTKKQAKKEAKREIERVTARNRLIAFGVVIAFIAFIAFGVFTLMAASKRVAAEQAERATSEKDRDYLEILQLKYENAAVINMAQAWSTEYPRAFPSDVFRKPHEFVQPVFDKSDATSDLIGSQILRKRADFAARHGLDSGEWNNSFKKSFPERDLIFDEIKLEIRPIVGRQVHASFQHLFNNKKFNDVRYSEDYFREMAPNFVAEVREEVRNLRSVKALRAKVLK